MSEYDDCYSEKLFHHQSEGNQSLRNDSNYSEVEYVDFNQNFSFDICKVENVEFQSKHLSQKIDDRDTDYVLGAKDKDDAGKTKTDEKVKRIRRIDVNAHVENAYLKVKRGEPKQTMELNINFKTIFCNLIRNLIEMKILQSNERQCFLQYKSQSPSFKSLAKFLNSPQNQQSKLKIKHLMASPLIVAKILRSDLRIDNKIVMIKFLYVMKLTVQKRNEDQKWKRIK